MRLFAWEIVTGCTRISPGCAICPAMDALTASGRPASATFHEGGLGQLATLPGAWKVAVAPGGDLFHEAVGDEALDQVFEAIEAESGHSYEFLTKRAARMAAYLASRYPQGAPANLAFGIAAEGAAEAEARLGAVAGLQARLYVVAAPMISRLDLSPWLARLERVVIGGEGLPPPPTDWVEALAKQCRQAGTPLIEGGRLL